MLKKFTKKAILLTLCLMVSAVANAAVFTANGINYETISLQDKTCKVVAADGGAICVQRVESGAAVEVYNTNGALVYAGDKQQIEVPTAGFYIVRVAGAAHRVFVNI